MFTTQPGKLPIWTGCSEGQHPQGSSPLLSLHPQVSTCNGQRVLTWDANVSGQQLATGFSALGFRVNSTDNAYLLYLDEEADLLLLRLYDVTTALRWRAPQRQLLLFETLSSVTAEVGDG